MNPMLQMLRASGLAVILIVSVAEPFRLAHAGDATLGFSAPNNTKAKVVTVKITYPDGSVYSVTATVAPGDTAIQKRNKIADAIEAHVNPKWRVDRDPNEAVLTVKDLPKSAVVEFDPGETGEASDRVVVPKLIVGVQKYEGVFEPYDGAGLPAVFTAGIVTDVGELVVQVSSEELDFQTEGPVICQALFQRLAPHAPPYRAQILYAGDRLEVYFDPAYSIGGGGVIFGTTSPSAGCAGSVAIPEGPDCNGNGVPDEVDIANGDGTDCNHNFVLDECDITAETSPDRNGNGVPDECELLPGDLNCDGVISYGDINPFVLALGGQSGYEAQYPGCLWMNADVNGDAAVTYGDINPFVELLNSR